MEGVHLRDTRKFYLDASPEAFVAPGHVSFAKERAGREILDYGCATGNYCLTLAEAGFRCTGVDINESYAEKAREHGVNAHTIVAGRPLPFRNDSFDTVLLFEVLEHVPDYEFVLEEARRVARKNVLVTVPNCGEAPALLRASLVADHMLELDHVNFFTPETIERSLASIFRAYEIREEEYKDAAFFRLLLPRFFAAGLSVLARSGLLRKKFSYRIFAEALI